MQTAARPRSVVSIVLATALAVGLAGCGGCGKAPPVPLEGEATGPLVFPPTTDGWVAREPLPAPKAPSPSAPNAAREDEDAIHVESPSLSADGTFEAENAHTIEIRLSESIFESTAESAKAPKLTISPSVPVRTVWTSPWTVELRSETPLDPSTDFTIALPEITAPNGHKLRGGWKGRFRPRTESIIGGKTVPFVPVPGVLRPVYVRPIEDTFVGPAREMVVLYDQPIAIDAAKKLLTASIEKTDEAVPLVISHPPAGKTFEGEKIDTAAVLLVRFGKTLAPGTRVLFQAKSQFEKQLPITRKLTIADLPKIGALGCINVEKCDVQGMRVKASPHAGISIPVSNWVRDSAVKGHVTVTPAPANLVTSGGGESIYVDAAWQPATTYQIHVAGVLDKYGYRVPETTVTFEALPRSYAAVLREGVLLLDETGAKDFYVTTRNVKKGVLRFWPVGSDASSLSKALGLAMNNDAPPGSPVKVAFDGADAPHVYTRTGIDLTGRLEPGKAYLAQVEASEGAYGAARAEYPSWSDAAKPSVPLVLFASKDSVGAHAHVAGTKAIVQVYRLASGEAVPGAEVVVGSTKATTDAKGTARLDLPPSLHLPAQDREPTALVVRAGSESTVVPLTERLATRASSLYPELTHEEPAREIGYAGFVVTDRGIYQPGSKLHIKATLRKNDGDKLAAAPDVKVRLRVEQPYTGEMLLDEAFVTNEAGNVVHDVEIPASTHSGNAQLRLSLDDEKKTVVAEQPLRIATFERPRFLVDVDGAKVNGDALDARIVGRYGFGTPMEDGRVTWSVSRKPATIDGGVFGRQGYAFGREHTWRDEWPVPSDPRPVTGTGKLDAKGSFVLHAVLGPTKTEEGPVELSLEADVTDASYRHVAAKKTIVKHAGERYAGVRLASSFGGLGPVRVDVVAVDTAGKSLGGVPVEVRAEKVAWKRAASRAESGATIEAWTSAKTVVGSCSVVTDPGAGKPCELRVDKGGEYRITTVVDGREDTSSYYYAWNDADEAGEAVPSSGVKIPVATDKKSYHVGESAKVLAQSPFAEATALLTIENGGVLSHQVKDVKGGAVVFDVPVTGAHAPHAYAAITLLPKRTTELSYRVGAVKIPVVADGALAVSVTSSKKTYENKETADITVEVKRGGKPVKGADVTLAVVDEGVLRLTSFHATDPTKALHPARALDFFAADSRALLFRRKEKAHAPGGGGAEDDAPVGTRKDFADTALWKPDLVTAADGRATISLKLPDNLTEWRMMAVAIDESGTAGAAESGFLVTRPFLLEPVLPRFALRGDDLELAAMVHNNTPAATTAKVTIGGEVREVALAANGHTRVATKWKAERSRDVTMSLEVAGKVRDKVERHVNVGLPGTEEHPQLSGVFREAQEVTVKIPADAVFDDDAKLEIKTGSALYPELGQRLAFLRDYPHGCVEQTTSGTIPYLAAKNILAWTGVKGMDDEETKKRIEAGVKRLGTMRVPGGGLAYWPGGTETHEFGTAYAARALLRAAEMDVEEPGLLSHVLGYLEKHLGEVHDPIVKVSIAEVLAQADRLKDSSADALWDTREKLDVYGTASLALALSSLDGQQKRTSELLDVLEASFDENAVPKKGHGKDDWRYWSSYDRDRAQALVALVKLRPKSNLAPVLARRLSKRVDGYTTQSLAWSLLAMSDFVGKTSPSGKVDVKVRVEGRILDTTRKLGGNNKEVSVPLAELRGKTVVLRLEGEKDAPSAFAMEARYARPDESSERHAKREKLGPSIHRVYTDPKGNPVDLAKLAPGSLVRVALRASVRDIDSWRGVYLALTDRFAAGFEPVETDLASVASVPDIGPTHPFYGHISNSYPSASHVDVRDDRVNVYFDHAYGEVYATYLLRAVTPGEFVMPAAHGELMYEPGSEGYSEAARVTIR